MLSIAVKGFPDTPLTRAQIEALPYASLGAKIGRGPRSMLVLGENNRGLLHWFSADHIVLITQNGRLMRTAGMNMNLANTTFPQKDALQTGEWQYETSRTNRVIDLTPKDIFRQLVTSQWQKQGLETIEILDRQYETIHIMELCHCKGLGWEFENHFWLDRQSHFVWRSQQHIHPELPSVVMEVFKPADLTAG